MDEAWLHGNRPYCRKRRSPRRPARSRPPRKTKNIVLDTKRRRPRRRSGRGTRGKQATGIRVDGVRHMAEPVRKPTPPARAHRRRPPAPTMRGDLGHRCLSPRRASVGITADPVSCATFAGTAVCVPKDRPTRRETRPRLGLATATSRQRQVGSMLGRRRLASPGRVARPSMRPMLQQWAASAAEVQ